MVLSRADAYERKKNAIISEEVEWWGGGKIVNFRSIFTFRIKINATLATIHLEMGFLFASEELKSALICSGDKTAFSTDAKRKRVSELRSDYVVPLGNKAVIKFQNKMWESRTVLLLGRNICFAVTFSIF